VVVRAAEAAGTVTISVQDNGVGIPEDEVDSLFSPEGSSSRQGTAGETGAGLGLVLCREIVEQYGGQIWAESTRGEGTTVSFTLPTSADAENGEEAPEETEKDF
jgi:signal transduction histidine kinase